FQSTRRDLSGRSSSAVTVLAWDPAERVVVAGTRAGALSQWQIPVKRQSPAGLLFDAHRGMVRVVAMHPTESLMASASDDGVETLVCLWDTKRGQVRNRIRGDWGAPR